MTHPQLFPTAGTLGEFAGGRILSASGFALFPMAAVEVQLQARIVDHCPPLPLQGHFRQIHVFANVFVGGERAIRSLAALLESATYRF
jgi:hypothetical protein